MKAEEARDKLIIALDVPTFEEARLIVEQLGGTISTYKVGFQLFTAYGPFIVRYLQAQGKKVFLDLKFHDIPNTVANAVASATGLSMPVHEALDSKGQKTGKFAPLFMLTVHTQGGAEMMKAAAEAAKKRAAELKVPRPLIVGVTVLTSEALANVTDVVLERARLARSSGLDGVVSSAQEATMLRREMGQDFVIVTPGIRPADTEAGDQKRVETPAAAIKNGASFLVVGRPIVKAAAPREAARKILEEIAGVK
jgi:orotidine-5'-phosphate decarboxylase